MAKCQWCGGPMNDCSGLFVAACMDCKREVAPWPKPLKWTPEKPTEPGVYVYRAPSMANTLGGLLRIPARHDERDDYKLCDWPPHGLWLGPLPEIPETQDKDAQTAGRS